MKPIFLFNKRWQLTAIFLFSLLILWITWPTPKEFRDVVYANQSPAQKLDLYLPAGRGPFPLIIFIHGGGWRMGDKQAIPPAIKLAVQERGYALASLNYRFSNEAIFPAQIHDVKTAVRYLRANAPTYHLDANYFGVWGASAGGHLASLLGTSSGVESLEGIAMGYTTESSQVQAVVDWFGPTDFLQMDEQTIANNCPLLNETGHNDAKSSESQLIGVAIQERPDLVQSANPISYITTDDSPFLIQHGTQDCLVPPQQSQILYDALLPVIGIEHVSLIYLPAGHGEFSVTENAFDNTKNITLLLNFFDQYLKPESSILSEVIK